MTRSPNWPDFKGRGMDENTKRYVDLVARWALKTYGDDILAELVLNPFKYMNLYNEAKAKEMEAK